MAPVLPPRRLSRREARHSRRSSAIELIQTGNSIITHLANGTTVTGLHSSIDNQLLAMKGFTVRHIETFHDQDDESFITWDAPDITEADLPY